MIVRRQLILVLTIGLTLWAQPGSGKGERWSRQVLNSEWIPLAHPRSLHETGSLPGIVPSGVGNPAQLQPLALPLELRQQYQQQLFQLQETQESIQKLLLLQQQLRAQQQLLQAQSYLPEGFATDEERKSALHQSTIANLQTLPHLAPEALIPPQQRDQPQLPELSTQDFQNEDSQKTLENGGSLQSQEESANGQNGENGSGKTREKTRDHATRQGGHYKNSKQLRDSQNARQYVSQSTPSSLDAQNEGDEEVQLLYVPAETLAQREQQKTQRVRNRKQHTPQQQQQQLNRQQTRYQQAQKVQETDESESQGLEGTRPSVAQQAFAHQVLYQLQQEQAERNRIQQEEREKEIARLNEEQKELERHAQLHQELVIREQELKKQKALELRKELERQEEEARLKELAKIREAKQRKLKEDEEAARKKEIERQEELERRKIAEIRAQDLKRKEAEARQAEIDRLAALERQKELEIQRALEQQQELERQQAEDEARARAQFDAHRQAQANSQLESHRQAHQENIERQRQAQIDATKLDAHNRAQNQAQQQHLTETVRPKSQRLKSRQRQKNRQDSQPSASSPNQPPLSVYMGSTSPVTNPEDLRVSDVLTILKDAKTISVLDSVGPDSPLVFVGPTNLEPPTGYAKFDLPYLSTIDNNRVERKVDKLPFFVAPLSFKPPPGYAKIPFPAPHIGSVVVNTLDNEPDSLDVSSGGVLKPEEALHPSPEPLIEPNSYANNAQFASGNHFASQATPEYPQEALVSATTPSYEASYSTTPSSGTRYRHRQFYNDKPALPSSTPRYEDHSSADPGSVTRNTFRQFYPEEQGHGTLTYNSEDLPTPQPTYQAVTPPPRDHGQQNFQVDSGQQNVGTRFSSINQELSQNQDHSDRYNAPSVTDQQFVKNQFQEVQSDHLSSEVRNPETNHDSQGLRNQFNVPPTPENSDIKASPGPIQYTLSSELPRISHQLPGLVNSLIDQREFPERTIPPTTTSTTTTTTTTTIEPPTTTYRSRGRQRGRVVPTRAPTTTEVTPTRSSTPDKLRRPYSRSRVRHGYATTTETYQETVYEPTKSKLSGGEEKTQLATAPETQRRPLARNQRYRGRGSDRNAVQSETHPDAGNSQQDHNSQNQEANYPNSASSNRHHPQGPPNVPVYHEDAFLSSPSPSLSESDSQRPHAQPLQGAVQNAGVAHESESPNFQHNTQEIEGLNYHTGIRTSNFDQSNFEQSPVNGFNYQSQNGKVQAVSVAAGPVMSSPQQYPLESLSRQQPQTAEQIYGLHGNQAGDSPGKENSNNFHNIDLNHDQIYASPAPGDHRDSPDHSRLQEITARPIYDHQSEINQNNDFQLPSTTTESPEISTVRPTLTPAPITVRQRVRTRPSQSTQRPHVDAPIQTRPTGSRDEFVRFSAVNQESRQQPSPTRTQTASRLRPRNRGQVNQPQVQTGGNEYVRIQTPPQRPITTTTTTTTPTPQAYANDGDEEIEYGFIRPPSFKPIHPINDRPSANIAPTFRSKYEQVETEESTNDAPVEVHSSQSQTLKNRQKYQVMNRRPLPRSTTSSPLVITTLGQVQSEDVYTVRPKVRTEQGRTRGRVRRPGKRRTTTTSTSTTTTSTTTAESILDSSNELPLDENYPRIIQGVHPAPNAPRQTLFDEELKSPNLETLPQAEPLQHNPAQLHTFQHHEDLQFPRQDFILNFGIGSDHVDAHEEYDQTQLASSPQQKFKHVTQGAFQPHHGNIPVADIEGAESQWSTKLTQTSFQPSSLPNQVHIVSKSNERQEKSEDSFDIITARPDLPANELLVEKDSNVPRDIVVNTSYLGNTRQEGTESKNIPETTPVLQGRFSVQDKHEAIEEVAGSYAGHEFWSNKEEKKTEQKNHTNSMEASDLATTPKINQEALNSATDIPTTMIPKKSFDDADLNSQMSTTSSDAAAEPTATKRTVQRRRRVRIRVRPTEDFVSAESQHVGSAWNSFIREKQGYEKGGSYVNSKYTTSTSPSTPPTSTTEATTARSFFEDLFHEITKDADAEVQSATTSTTTNVPDNLEPTTQSFSQHPEETETQTVTTELPTTTVELQTTLVNDKYVTEAVTEHHKFSPKSHEQKMKPLEDLMKPKTTESDLGLHRFHPKHPEHKWWNHRYEAATNLKDHEPENTDEKLVSDHVTAIPESTTEVVTKTDTEEADVATVQGLSDYMNAFFKTISENQGHEEETTSGTEETTQGWTVSTLKTEAEFLTQQPVEITLTPIFEGLKSNETASTEAPTTVNGIEEAHEKTKPTGIGGPFMFGKKEGTFVSTRVEVPTTLTPETTSNSVPQTTPEVPLSPEELTTEASTAQTATSDNQKTNSTPNQLAKVLRTSTTTEISHMTEICYRGRCVKTKSRKEIRRR